MNGRAYYNEIDPYVCAWLRNLIAANLIAPGDVDERDIRDVRPADLDGYTQCHFFAGIGGWSYALRLAGWPDDRPVWTGSCPCQPWSDAGQRKGSRDDRHLWPAWHRLVCERAPPVILGEQTARAVGFGWLDTVAIDLEAAGYAFGAAELPACAVAAPHERARIWFVAHADGEGQSPRAVHAKVGTPPDAPSTFSRWGVEPQMVCMANGVPSRVAQVRSFGNAIVPRLAAEFIKAAAM